MKNPSATHKGLGTTCTSRILRAVWVLVVCAGCLVTTSAAHEIELKGETLTAWDAYLQAANSQASSQTPFLWVDRIPERLQRVRAGEILVSPVGEQMPKPVPYGLVHDWIGAAFIPDATIEDILFAVRDYGNYKAYYKPTVVDSRLLSSAATCEKYSMRVVNKEAVAQTALDMEYETCYFKAAENRWYSITRTTNVQEIRHYGQAGEQELPPDRGSGYIWRLYSVARFEQRDGGTYVEIEAIGLSRDIPVAVRWFVNPIVRRISRNSLLISLEQTRDAVRLAENAGNNVKSPTTAENRSRSTFASPMAVTRQFASPAKP